MSEKRKKQEGYISLNFIFKRMSLGQEILNTLKKIRNDIKSFTDSKQYHLISYDTEPDLIPRFPALAYYLSAASITPYTLSSGYSHEFSAVIVLYKKIPLNQDAQLDEEVADLIDYFLTRGYEIGTVSMEDTSMGTALLRRAEISIKLPKFLK